MYYVFVGEGWEGHFELINFVHLEISDDKTQLLPAVERDFFILLNNK